MPKHTIDIQLQTDHYQLSATRIQLASGQMITAILIPDDTLTAKEARSGVKIDDYGKERAWSFPAHNAAFAGEKGSDGKYYPISILGGLGKLKLDFQLFDEPQGTNAKTSSIKW